MTHEFINLVKGAIYNQTLGISNVLATVVDLDGSSYRQPGVRMLLSSNGEMLGAVSGGCVEKEVQFRAKSVFNTGQPVIMTYDGRYRLGCEGVLYILLEPFEVSKKFETTFFKNIENRTTFTIQSYYKKEEVSSNQFYSSIIFENNESFTFSNNQMNATTKNIKTFSQTLPPCFKLLIVGGEHDAVKLCKMAALLGWDINVITSIKDPKALVDFPGAKQVEAHTPETFSTQGIDQESAIVLMTHNYSQDLRYLLKFKDCNVSYIGILGSAKRREQLHNDLLDYTTELNDAFLENIHSPAGLNIGAITPEEIALSILSEITAIKRHKEPHSLNSITGKIHS
ncbi:XdhC family protein [uncultured Algibacter sp.]|uniref:XdhC family protein n=1 Tax=uncultured Algibacter sp. TaxID=298659 RepID=UPI003216DBB6